MHEIVQTYLKYPSSIVFSHLKMLDGHRAPRIFPVAHVRGSTIAANPSDVYKFLLENIRSGYDLVSLADLREESQTPLPEFFV